MSCPPLQSANRSCLYVFKELMSQGMQNAEQALLSGCSAGGLASIIHCDEFRSLFPKSSKVKCFSDAGFFIDAVDISGGRTLRKLFGGVVQLQEVQKNLPERCVSKMDPTSCFFPQNRVEHIETPLFLLNAAYDVWQVQASLAPPSADPLGNWNECRSNHANCNTSQIQFLQDFRNEMLNDVKDFSEYSQTGLFINSCFAHCQSERQETWFADNSPLIGDKPIAIAVGDWYFDREVVKAIDCAYPCCKKGSYCFLFRIWCFLPFVNSFPLVSSHFISNSFLAFPLYILGTNSRRFVWVFLELCSHLFLFELTSYKSVQKRPIHA